MLVLTRKLMEKLYIGDAICVTVVRLEGGQVRLGIEAPRQRQRKHTLRRPGRLRISQDHHLIQPPPGNLTELLPDEILGRGVDIGDHPHGVRGYHSIPNGAQGRPQTLPLLREIAVRKVVGSNFVALTKADGATAASTKFDYHEPALKQWDGSYPRTGIPAIFPEGEIPLTGGRIASAADVANAIVMLCSDRARHVTGTWLQVDGGQSLLR